MLAGIDTPSPNLVENDTIMEIRIHRSLNSEFNDEENKNSKWLILQAEIIPPSRSSPTHLNILKSDKHCQRRFGIVVEMLMHRIDLHSISSLRATCQKTTLNRAIYKFVDPLAMLLTIHNCTLLSSSPATPSPQPTAQSPNDALMATMTQIANLLSGFQKQFPPTNNQLRTSSNSRTHATCKEPKRKMDSQYFKDKALLMEAKEKGTDFNKHVSTQSRGSYDTARGEGPMLLILPSWPTCHSTRCRPINSAMSSNCLCEDLRSACDREHTKVLELEAEISKQKQLITESEKRFAFLEQNYVNLQLKFQNYKQCIDTSSASNAIFEINKLRQQLQGKDTLIPEKLDCPDQHHEGANVVPLK
ncbi:hypothetical protein Tco_0570447 [Tanacetum coccineum]